MSFPILLNPLFQMTAAFIIFFAGFITLFAFGVLCVVVGWALYRCTNRLALLIAHSQNVNSSVTVSADSSSSVAGLLHPSAQSVQSPPVPS
jgi:hypothetical protein